MIERCGREKRMEDKIRGEIGEKRGGDLFVTRWVAAPVNTVWALSRGGPFGGVGMSRCHRREHGK